MSSKRTATSVEVIKVPTERPASRPKRFPRMPRMYLELVENKDKIKQELVNKEYNPDLAPPLPQEPAPPASPAVSEAPSATSVASSAPSKSSAASSSRSKDDSDSSDDDSSDASSVRSYSSSDSSSSSFSGSESGSGSDASSDFSDSDSDSDSDRSSVSDSSDEGDELSGRIKELLKEDNDATPERRREKEEKRERHHKRHDSSSSGRRETPDKGGMAPPLAELEASGVYQSKKHYPDISQSAVNEQEEENVKHEILYKFALLKKSYRGADIPEFTIHSDLSTMTRSYENTVRRLSLESNVDTYKKYLIGGFMLVEYILGRFLKLDMEGFTRQQMINMNSYDRLLIELGEKSYVPGDSKWPVELRLLGMIMINAGFFVVTKMLGKMSGSDIMGMFNAFNGAPPVSAAAPQAPKRRMQGPSINLDELSE